MASVSICVDFVGVNPWYRMYMLATVKLLHEQFGETPTQMLKFQMLSRLSKGVSLNFGILNINFKYKQSKQCSCQSNRCSFEQWSQRCTQINQHTKQAGSCVTYSESSIRYQGLCLILVYSYWHNCLLTLAYRIARRTR